MKVLLAQPRFEENTNPPLGLGYIAACMEQENIDVEILDPAFRGYDYAVSRLKKTDYGLLGFSCFTMNIDKGEDLAAIAKAANPNVHVCFGGPHPTIAPQDVIPRKPVDSVCIGEGEITMVELAKALEKGRPISGIKGLAYSSEGKPVYNEPRPLIADLDSIPFPARHLLPMDDYLKANIGRGAWAVKQPSTSIMAMRGCPFCCTYCSSHLIFGRRTRFRSAKNVVEELETLVMDYGINGFVSQDDTFTINRKWAQEFSDRLMERKLNLEWICNSRVDTVDLETLKKMKGAGCRVISYGIESGNQWVLDNLLKKGINLEKVKKAFGLARQAGLETSGLFMLGIPGESKAQMEETIGFAKSIGADSVNFNITRPMPFTEMYDIAKKTGTIHAEKWEDYDFSAEPIYESKEFSIEDIKKIQKRAYRSFYFDPRYVLRQLARIRGLSDLDRVITGLKMVLRA